MKIASLRGSARSRTARTPTVVQGSMLKVYFISSCTRTLNPELSTLDIKSCTAGHLLGLGGWVLSFRVQCLGYRVQGLSSGAAHMPPAIQGIGVHAALKFVCGGFKTEDCIAERTGTISNATCCAALNVERIGLRRTALTEMCGGFEAGSYLRLIDFVYHSTPGLRVVKKKRKNKLNV